MHIEIKNRNKNVREKSLPIYQFIRASKAVGSKYMDWRNK